MKLEVKHLRLLKAIAEEGGVTKATRRLHRTQSALSHQLLALERRLGTDVFVRTGKRMLPTEAGRRLLETADRVLEELKRAEDEVGRLARGEWATLRISTECYTCYHWLPQVMEQFREAHPGVKVQIVPEVTRRPVAALLDGKLDLALVSCPVTDDRLREVPLFEDEMVLLVPPGHELAGRPWVEPEDFADQHVFLYVSPAESTVFQRVLDPAGVRPLRVTELPLTEAILEMVKAGEGVSVMARWAVRESLAEGSLMGVQVTAQGMRRRWSAAVLAEDPLPGHVVAFAELLAQPPVCCAAGCAAL